MERTYDYDKEDYVMRRSNTNRGYFCCAFYGPRAYFLHGGTEQLYQREDKLYDVANETQYDKRKFVGRYPNKYYQEPVLSTSGKSVETAKEEMAKLPKMGNPIASEIKLPRTEDGVIFAVTDESKENETLQELILRNRKPTNKSDRFSVERVDTKHMKVTLDGGNAFFFSNRQWDLVKKHILNSHYGSMDQARVRYEERQTTPIFKAQPGDTIFYIDDNKVCSANLIEITFRWTEGQKKVTKYTTVHGTYTADRIFKTKDELIKSL